MAIGNIKQIGKQRPQVGHEHTNAWEVMKPFVHFGIKATVAIAHTLIAIVKNIPKPVKHKPKKFEDGKVVKI